jgi:ferric iron reductase protein FhuF
VVESSATRVIAALPGASEFLLVRPGDTEVRATALHEPAWVAEQLRLRGEQWRVDDIRTLATLWWFNASVALMHPSVLSIAAGGPLLSPRLEHVVLHVRDGGRLSGSHSDEAMPGRDLNAFAAALQDMLATAIEQLRPFVPRVRPLWAIATDSFAERLAWAGQRTGRSSELAQIAMRIVRAVGDPMPLPRFVEDEWGPAGRMLARRISCCLLYRVPRESACANCPRRGPGR